jgi:hypothetical protein
VPASDADAAVFARLIAKAEEASERGDWASAAHGWTAASALAERADRPALEGQLLATAGEAFRRADRPTDALNALEMAMARGHADARTRTALSAVLASMARPAAALAAARAAGDHVLARDAVAGVLLATGTRTELERAWRAIDSPLAATFRRAQWLRLSGRLDEAREALVELERDADVAAAGRGGIRLERAEIDALQGDLAAAVEVFEAAAHDQESAGRMALVWAVTAAHGRCLLDAGLDVAFPLDQGIAWADERGLAVLAWDLELVRARAQGNSRVLAALHDRASAAGLIRRAGRASLARAEHAAGPMRLVYLTTARNELAEDLPLTWRVATAHAEALAELDPEAGARAARQVVTAVERAGMRPEHDRLVALEGACSKR